MLQLIAAELQVNLLHVPVDVVMGHAFGSPVQRITAVIVATDRLDREPADVAPGEPKRNSRC